MKVDIFQDQVYNWLSGGLWNHVSFVFIQTAIIFMIFLGYGRFFSRLLLGVNNGALLSTPEKAVLGIFFSALVSLATNFFTPINGWISILYMGIGLCFLFWPFFGKYGRKNLWKAYWFKWTIGGLGMLLLCLKALTKGTHPDTGIYHLPSISWIHYEMVPLGSVNVLGGLAFNSVWSNVVSLFWHSGFTLGSIFCVNIVIVFLGYLSMADVFTRKYSSVQGFFASSFAFLLFVYFSTFGATIAAVDLSSVANDIPSGMLCAIAFLAAVKLLQPFSPAEFQAKFTVFIFAALLSILIKLSYAFIAFVPILILIFTQKNLKAIVNQLLVARHSIACVILLITLWMAKGIMISGCAIFPAADTCIPSLPWGDPSEIVHKLQNATRVGSLPGEVTANQDDLLHSTTYLKTTILNVGQSLGFSQISVIFVVSSLLLMVVFYPFKKRFIWIDIKAFCVLFISALLVVSFWFFNAPSVRYVYGSLPTLLLCPLALLLTPPLSSLLNYKNGIAILSSVAIILFCNGMRWTEEEKQHYGDPRNFIWPVLPTYYGRDIGEHKNFQGMLYRIGYRGLCYSNKPPCGQNDLTHYSITHTEGGRYYFIHPTKMTQTP